MAVACPACSKTNPANAQYCYYDGRPLSQEGREGPLRVGSLPFSMPFYFADGQSCANFNQLALACDERWDQARQLLAEGMWPAFFNAIGRLDLAAAAKQAAKEPDLDVGLSQLLEKFPADQGALRLPKLALSCAEVNLGTLTPGADHRFDLVIRNQGMLVLRGMIMAECDWLAFGDGAGPPLKMFQTRSIHNLPVRVLGNKLRAGQKPLEAEIVIDTNGGAVTLPVRASVPIRPFPHGQYANDALAGAMSPHEIAVKAKAHPEEAAILFEQGAVKAWYASNGWSYPVEGSQGSGKGAVQQFFEALGLTKPPRLEISSSSLVLKGRAGSRLSKKVTISTQEAKAVYAQAWSDCDWVTFGPSKPRGNHVSIPVEVVVPPRPGETVQAKVTFQGNGKQLFVVPVTVTAVEAESVYSQPDGAPDHSLGWIAAGVGLVLLLAAGFVWLAMNNRNGEPGNPPIVQNGNPAPPPVTPAPPAPKNEAWWDGIPGTTLPAAVAALKQVAPQEQAIFDGLAAKADFPRFEAYQKLVAKLPELMREPKARDALSRVIAECYALEPNEENVAPLRRWLTSQVPLEGADFRPEEKAEDLDRAFWSLEVGIGALTHKAIRLERVKRLAQDLGAALSFAIDPSAPPEQLKAQAEKLLALRCYRNTLATAARSVEHALLVRARLIEKVPQYLSPAFREKIDVDLIAVALATRADAWPMLEPILRSCLASSEPAINLKIVDLYEGVEPSLAQNVETALAAKWSIVADGKLSRAAKVAAIRNTLTGGNGGGKTAAKAEDRAAQWQKLARGTLTAAKSAPNQGLAVLQDTVRLAHASTMACALFQQGPSLARFDELVARVPSIEDADKDAAAGKADDSNANTIVGTQPRTIQGQLTAESERDPVRTASFRKVHLFTLQAGQVYVIDLASAGFDAYLRLEDPKGVRVAEDDDGGGAGFNARIVYPTQTTGVYRVIATTLTPGGAGPYTLQIQHRAGLGVAGFGQPGFGPPGFGGPGFFPRRPGFPQPGTFPGMAPAQANPNANSSDSQVNPTDLAELDGKQSSVRIAALQRIASNVPSDLAPRHAQRIARYLLSIQQKNETEEAADKMASFAKCRNLVMALADHAAKDEASQKPAEALIGALLGKRLHFGRDENWRLEVRKLLLLQALELTAAKKAGAEEAAEILCDLYKEQGLALGLEGPELMPMTRPAQVLESLINHVAKKAGGENVAREDKDYLNQIDRHLRVAKYLGENDLEHMVLLQRVWLKVLAIHLQERAPERAEDMQQVQRELIEHDRRAAGVIDQLRAGEEKLLQLWALVHDLK